MNVREEGERSQKGYQSILDFIEKLESLSQFQDRVDIPYSIPQIWRVFLNDLKQLIKVEVCALFLVDERTFEFVLREVEPEGKEGVCQKELDLQIECGVFSWIIKRRSPAVIPSLVSKNKKTVIMSPLSTIKQTLGFVFALASIEESLLTRENLKLLGMLAKQFSLVMENAFLYEKLKKENQSLQKAQAQILQAEKLASIGRLTAGAFHELLNPLNIIAGYIQFLIMDKNVDARTKKYLNIMKEQSDRIARIVKDLLQFSRYPSKQKKGKVKINELIEKVLSLLAYEMRFDKIKIKKQLDYTLPPITGDEEKISQVFYNLISNARDAMPGGGMLKISTSLLTNQTEDPINSKFIEIKFLDTGQGIPAENLDKIFDPFFTTKDTGRGTGLGLSITYGIIQEHGGKIKVKSRVNEGTEFTIALPVTNPEE